ncbi:MAG: ABC transporter permease [Pseudomonadota bacterium]
MNIDYPIALCTATVIAATPLVFAALGELIAERAGVLNLGVEGMMLAGALAAFAASVTSGSLLLGFIAAALAGCVLSLLFGLLTLRLGTNQVATGLALTLFGSGLSACLGRSYASLPGNALPPLHLPLLSDIPVLGPLLFRYDAAVYVALLLVALVSWTLFRTRLGLVLRAVGESPRIADALGHPVNALRWGAVACGGMLAGIGGAYLSTAVTPMWAEGISAGRGWIALALVVFAIWKPWRVLFGAWLFGGMTVLQLHAQALGIAVPGEFLSMLPYLATILVLVLICRDPRLLRLNQPASLGRVFQRER